jgi:hypothetical protein
MPKKKLESKHNKKNFFAGEKRCNNGVLGPFPILTIFLSYQQLVKKLMTIL